MEPKGFRNWRESPGCVDDKPGKIFFVGCFDPRWSPDNRPYVVTSNPANGADPEQEYLYRARRQFCKCFFVFHAPGGFIMTTPGRRVRQRRDATGAPTQRPESWAAQAAFWQHSGAKR